MAKDLNQLYNGSSEWGDPDRRASLYTCMTKNYVTTY